MDRTERASASRRARLRKPDLAVSCNYGAQPGSRLVLFLIGNSSKKQNIRYRSLNSVGRPRARDRRGGGRQGCAPLLEFFAVTIDNPNTRGVLSRLPRFECDLAQIGEKSISKADAAGVVAGKLPETRRVCIR